MTALPVMPEKMASESTPLIATVQVGPQERRYPHNIVRRFCTIALSSTLLAAIVTFLVTVVYEPGHGHHHHHHHDHASHPHQPEPWSWPGCKERTVTYEELREILLETPSGERAAEWSKYYTSGAHLAGQNYSQAAWTRDKWDEWGVKSEIVSYDVYLNRPKDKRLALLSDFKSSSSYKLAHESSLVEDVLEDDPTTSSEDSIPVFHGYSASGNVTGSFVYVNYGTYQDFEDLVQAGVKLEGKIALAKYGGIFRGLKVKRAQELGMIGTVIYTDPGDDGDITEENGYEKYPNGPARQPSSVQRGSVQFLSQAPGDPTTPGYPSKPDAPRGPTEEYIPSIPSLPISYLDALPILKALNGHGPKSSDFNKYWNRNQGLRYKGVEYNIGPTPDDIVLNLQSEQEYITTPLWDVIGVINGTIPDEVIVIGNHRDAWIVGGAGDPNSGSAVLNEVIRSFGKAVESGWKPLRTIVFASWDGEEYGLVGSTEWVEEFLPWVSASNVAYINVDVGVKGPEFHAAAAPLLNNVLYDVTAQVPSPNQTVKGQTVRDLWDGRISTMGSGSDFTAFQDYAGVPSIDMGFDSSPDAPVYHYHSNYDSYHWMDTLADPGWIYHRTMAQILGLVTAKLADLPVISFGAVDYAEALDSYIAKVEKKVESSTASASLNHNDFEDDEATIFRLRGTAGAGSAARGDLSHFQKSLGHLHGTIWELHQRATELDARAEKLREQIAHEELPWWRWDKKLKLAWEVRQVNDRYKNLERNFLYEGGLDGRTWFKHVVFAPGKWTGYAGAVFPGLDESIDAKDYDNALRWVDIIAKTLEDATKSIE